MERLLWTIERLNLSQIKMETTGEQESMHVRNLP